MLPRKHFQLPPLASERVLAVTRSQAILGHEPVVVAMGRVDGGTRQNHDLLDACRSAVPEDALSILQVRSCFFSTARRRRVDKRINTVLLEDSRLAVLKGVAEPAMIQVRGQVTFLDG